MPSLFVFPWISGEGGYVFPPLWATLLHWPLYCAIILQSSTSILSWRPSHGNLAIWCAVYISSFLSPRRHMPYLVEAFINSFDMFNLVKRGYVEIVSQIHCSKHSSLKTTPLAIVSTDRTLFVVSWAPRRRTTTSLRSLRWTPAASHWPATLT